MYLSNLTMRRKQRKKPKKQELLRQKIVLFLQDKPS